MHKKGKWQIGLFTGKLPVFDMQFTPLNPLSSDLFLLKRFPLI